MYAPSIPKAYIDIILLLDLVLESLIIILLINKINKKKFLVQTLYIVFYYTVYDLYVNESWRDIAINYLQALECVLNVSSYL